MSRFLRAAVSSEKGATSIEYALIAGLVAVVTIGGLSTLGDALGPLYVSFADSIP